MKLAMNYFEVFRPVHFRILDVSSITPTTMHTVYLIHMYTTSPNMFRCVSHHRKRELKYSLLKTISIDNNFGKADAFE
jgi:hypothetical protein